jgi:AcrR family transcriptional regulator
MPKLGMPPLRRRALIDAAILTIGERGTLDVTMSEIAGRAGVSSALAHHYFGAKDGLLQATTADPPRSGVDTEEDLARANAEWATFADAK